MDLDENNLVFLSYWVNHNSQASDGKCSGAEQGNPHREVFLIFFRFSLTLWFKRPKYNIGLDRKNRG